MNEIKVTVTYDKPTTSKFDALMAEYEAAKKYADETVSYYKPLADAAEEAKMMAILEQLETIKEYADRLSMLSEKKQAEIKAFIDQNMRGGYHSSGSYFSVYRNPYGEYIIRWAGQEFTLEKLKTNRYDFTNVHSNGYNILGRWDEWKVYELLEREALRQIKSYIAEQKRRANLQTDRLNNITKGGN